MIYTIEYSHDHRTWSKLGWAYLYTNADTANRVVEIRQRRHPNTSYRVVTIEVHK
jgi:hypothetical protein